MSVITQEELLQYLYRETSAERNSFIKQALENDSTLAERMQVLRAGKERLDKLKLLSPDDRTVENIFNYSDREVKEIS